MLKLSRNHFVDSGFMIHGEHLTVDLIQKVLVLKNMSETTIAHKLSQSHITVDGTARQKVKLAAQLFSNSVSSAMKFLGEKGLLDGQKWQLCSKLLKIINDWFDLFNIRVKEHDSRVFRKAFGLNLEKQSVILNQVSQLMEDIHVGNHRTKLPFQKGVLISNQSLIDLQEFLPNKYGLTYILTYCLNQDALSHVISACALHPPSINQCCNMYL